MQRSTHAAGLPGVQASPAAGPGQRAAAPEAGGELTVALQACMVDRLAAVLKAGAGAVLRMETQISWVLVSGAHAYKVKKALRLPFLDYTTLAARHTCCQAEYRLNQRLAPELYLDVVPVTGSLAHPALGGAGHVLDYAVKMAAFDQRALWSRRLEDGGLDDGQAEALAVRLGQFHLAAPAVPAGVPWGTPGYIAHTVGATLAELSKQVPGDAGQACLAGLRKLEAASRPPLFPVFRQRRAGGKVRECHGDLHCGNIVSLGRQGIPFDGIEFADGLRWIDVMDDVSFLHMDLAYRGRPDLAARLLSRYLEVTGDYDGLAVLPYYRMHRALVRAKVLLERAAQDHVPAAERAALRAAADGYLRFARGSAPAPAPAIMVTHGCAGSGKSVLSRYVVSALGALQIRSDVERKRIWPATATLYSAAASRRTYERLAALARAIVQSGWPVIVDAAFLRAWQRELLRALAAELSVPFFLFDVRAPEQCMRERVAARLLNGLDASDAGVGVLERQLQNQEPLTEEELAHALVVDTGAGLDLQRVRAACAPVLAHAAAGHPPGDTSTGERYGYGPEFEGRRGAGTGMESRSWRRAYCHCRP
ncbi:bifunctional aminoglycoside phosphotransferase/ATP-binding protein [Pseudoduganella ginsengisoli]|uniref:AAA family ATPase n=1 Tax=Pseudoduganella ginsengisoli TaxID=1462440 RepID=A0A6L6Q4J0_9BURK|nr:bifunctional aminoglycoside phosphotransferase/ATP-binding protein [Pseudoduganella ginsengisoli]MTW04620.1 AAA family ATPase [Pseudoduganella ginsengisoli]